ncbi:hypothetical protein Q8W25_19835 [Shimia thalassica]|jgi:hypothetical protein|uniref:hypothetical protein n=1 Tax=Shimia thalassica TaxID=1715693 RepID=UPI000C06FFC6|nr:hypothetical protein [Shimia thalassica]PHO02204.1 hypothetical protein CSC82_19650 [Rhodobacteraceae bacterium 4F10]MBU2941888.1 hypothetical protein [Shimia thalassica]MDO6505227.1 hypothetical protein [Shimia thalassica]MDO6800419.1 hypothetical protein [Shimia thalassica]MDP2496285.1 hypothetical protein [Shimia thalassica]
MKTIPINEAELGCLGLFRMALSENTHEARVRAIAAMRHEVVSLGLESFPIRGRGENDPEFVRWVAETSAERHEAAHAYAAIAQRYDRQNKRKLNVAEHIGKLVWDSIQDQRFQGLQTKNGILAQVREDAKAQSVEGARDKDTLRKIWKCYRGVVHLGMALDYCEDNPDSHRNVLHLAERFRLGLNRNCPKGTKTPYVSESNQISFLYLSSV